MIGFAADLETPPEGSCRLENTLYVSVNGEWGGKWDSKTGAAHIGIKFAHGIRPDPPHGVARRRCSPGQAGLRGQCGEP